MAAIGYSRLLGVFWAANLALPRSKVERHVSFDIFSMFSVMGMIVLVLMSVIVLSKKVDHPVPNRFLSALLLAIALSQFNAGLVFYTGLLYSIPHVVDATYTFIALIGPLFFFYISALKSPKFRFTPRRLIHAVPVLVAFALKLPVYLMSGTEKIALITRWMEKKHTFEDAILEYVPAGVIMLIYTGYIAATFLIARKERFFPRTENKYTYISWWIRGFLGIAIFMFALMAFFFFGIVWFGFSVHVVFRLIPFAITLCAFFLAIRGLSFPASLCSEPIPEEDIKGVKYRSLKIADKKASLYWAGLQKLIEEDKMYLQSDLSVGRIASRLKIPRSYVSYLISKYANTSFFEHINNYRLEEAKSMMNASAGSPKSVIDIAYNAGFNAKSTFYSYFKRKTGITPLEYISKRGI